MERNSRIRSRRKRPANARSWAFASSVNFSAYPSSDATATTLRRPPGARSPLARLPCGRPRRLRGPGGGFPSRGAAAAFSLPPGTSQGTAWRRSLPFRSAQLVHQTPAQFAVGLLGHLVEQQSDLGQKVVEGLRHRAEIPPRTPRPPRLAPSLPGSPRTRQERSGATGGPRREPLSRFAGASMRSAPSPGRGRRRRPSSQPTRKDFRLHGWHRLSAPRRRTRPYTLYRKHSSARSRLDRNLDLFNSARPDLRNGRGIGWAIPFSSTVRERRTYSPAGSPGSSAAQWTLPSRIGQVRGLPSASKPIVSFGIASSARPPPQRRGGPSTSASVHGALAKYGSSAGHGFAGGVHPDLHLRQAADADLGVAGDRDRLAALDLGGDRQRRGERLQRTVDVVVAVRRRCRWRGPGSSARRA